MNFCGRCTTDNSLLNFMSAVLTSTNPPIGTEVGCFIYYQDCCCEILAKRGEEVELLSFGWRKLSECRLNP